LNGIESSYWHLYLYVLCVIGIILPWVLAFLLPRPAAILRWVWLTLKTPEVFKLSEFLKWVLLALALVRKCFDFPPCLMRRLLESWIKQHYDGPSEDPVSTKWLKKLEREEFKDSKSRVDLTVRTELGSSDEEAIQDAAERAFLPKRVIIAVLIDRSTGGSGEVTETDLATALSLRINRKGAGKELKKLEEAPPDELVRYLLHQKRMAVIVTKGPAEDGDKMEMMKGLMHRHSRMLRVYVTIRPNSSRVGKK